MQLYSEHYNNIDLNITNNILKNKISKHTTFLCIGSDKIILDCLGPLTGTILKQNSKLNIIGDLFNPITNRNLPETLSNMKNTNNDILIIDCSLCSDSSNINVISIHEGPTYPGGLSSNKSPIGNLKITANTNYSNNPNIFNNSTSLSHVFSMANTISNIILNSVYN